MRRRQREARAVGDRIHRLHQCLAEGGFADDVGAVVVLHRARENLRRAGAVAIGDDHHRNVEERAVLGRVVVLVGVPNTATRVDDHLPLRQELVRHLDGLVERAARIAANVIEETRHPLRAQVVQRALHLAVGVLAPVLMTNVAGGRVDHEVRRDREDLHLVARHVQRQQLLVAATANLHLHHRALAAAQLLHRLLGGPPLGIVTIDARHHVAAADTHLEGRRAFEHTGRGDVALDRLDGDAEPVVAPLLSLAHLRVLTRVEEARVRIERREHAADGGVDHAVRFNLVDVLPFDGTERRRERRVACGQPVVHRERAAPEQSANQCRDGDDKHDDGDGTHTSHGVQGNRQIPYRATTSGYTTAGNSLTPTAPGSIIE